MVHKTAPIGRVRAALLCAALAVSPLLAPAAAHAQARTALNTTLPPPAAGEKVFHYAFLVAETGFDPAQISDLYSRTVTDNVFDALYRYDYLARPAKVKPNLADGMPEVADDYKTWTVRLKRGIHFAPDPVFQGKLRELTAHDVVYSYKRIYDPKTKSQIVSTMQETGMLGLDALREAARKTGKFDYDSEVDGIRALDRYTVQFKLANPKPRFISALIDSSTVGTVAREVVEHYGDRIMEHPVGTGAYMLAEWRRSSRMVFVKNPNYREEYWSEEPVADDTRGQEIAARLQGKRLPLVDRIVINVIDEPQPRWLAFLNGEHDFLERLPEAYINQAVPNNKIAPNLAKRGIQALQSPGPDITYWYYDMENPIVGGYTPDKVALRRALNLAYDGAEEVQLARRGQAIVAESMMMPTTYGYDPNFKSENGRYDRARAIALLDMFGYVDKDGDGWRDMPDGKPLVIEYSTLSRADYREYDEVMKKSFDAIGVKLVLKIGQWPEHLKAARAGKLMMWGLGLSAGDVDGGGVLRIGVSSQIGGGQNLARFRDARIDELYRKQDLMPNGPERLAVMKEIQRILLAYAPYKIRNHRIYTDLAHPQLIGFVRHPVRRDFWRFIDIDPSAAKAS